MGQIKMVYKIKSKFRNWQKEHPNFMTPYIIKLIQKGNDFIEISEGTDFKNQKIYGVTLIHHKKGEFKTDTSGKSQMFYSKEKAYKYAENL